MIHIIEDTAKKVSGDTSLFFNLPLKRPDVVETLLKLQSQGILDVVSVDKNTKVWEVPVTFLSKLIETLVYYDDIKLSLKRDNNVCVNECKPVLRYKTKPFKHQLEGIEYGLNHKGWLLLDDQGLGKTYQMIMLAEVLKKKENLQHCLIICGVNSLKWNWQREHEGMQKKIQFSDL